MKKYTVYTYHIADNIDIKGVKGGITGKVIAESNVDIFIELGTDEYMSAYEYGSVTFVNIDKVKLRSIIESISEFCENMHVSDDLSEDLNLDFSLEKDQELEYDEATDTLSLVKSMEKNIKVLRTIMFDLSQTVALDYYGSIGDKLLVSIKKFSKELEEKGKLSISKKEMMKFIGKSLNIKNNIIDTLYIFDSPDITWNNNQAAEVHDFLIHLLDIKSRFKETEYLTQTIGDNLDVYKELSAHKESSTLEIVVVILIIIEVLQGFAHNIKIPGLFGESKKES